MKRSRMLLLGAAMLAAASGVHAADPHWTAAIGTGRASDSGKQSVRSVATVSVVTANRASNSQPHWTARIGTGDPTRSEEKPLVVGRVAQPQACSCPAP
jgi:hypothetical protein